MKRKTKYIDGYILSATHQPLSPAAATKTDNLIRSIHLQFLISCKPASRALVHQHHISNTNEVVTSSSHLGMNSRQNHSMPNRTAIAHGYVETSPKFRRKTVTNRERWGKYPDSQGTRSIYTSFSRLSSRSSILNTHLQLKADMISKGGQHGNSGYGASLRYLSNTHLRKNTRILHADWGFEAPCA